MILIYHPDAEKELIEAAQYYERRIRTLGFKFVSEADRAVSLIMATPQRWSIIEEDVRSYSCLVFLTRFTTEIFPTEFTFLLSNITAGTQAIGDIELISHEPT